jgi:hypothetical protein
MPGIQLQLYRIERESKMPEATPYLISPATSSDGLFSFDRLKPANYEVQAVDASGVFFGPPKRIRLAESQEIEIKTILTEKFKVSGQVESVSSDLNLGGIVVICTDPNTYQSKETKTGPDGRFEFSGLREGAYLITLQVPALESVPIAQHIQIQKQNVELHRFKVAPLKNQDVISLLPTP